MQQPPRFQHCRDLYGNPLNGTAGRRNGKPALFFHPGFDSQPALEPPALEEQSRLFVNLNAVECITWRKLLQAQSIAQIAREEGVSRPAIYARIQGNRKGQGGMIAKNAWVLLWWRFRQRSLQRTTKINRGTI